MPDTVTTRYDQLIANGTLSRDADQHEVAARLDELLVALKKQNGQSKSGGWRKLFGKPWRTGPKPKSLYLWGGVGRGKTMLMDLFFSVAPVEPKRRIHFHDFMQEVHGLAHDFRNDQAKGLIDGAQDPIAAAAEQLASEAQILCFDEFQVYDITDAMIIGRLFEALMGEGVVVVATSNTPPGELYKDGLNRNAFMPFIRFLEAEFDTIDLNGPVDYRLNRLTGEETYHCPLGPGADGRVQWLWNQLTATHKGEPAELTVKGRTVQVPQAARNVARFDFSDLCEQPLGAADFIAIADAYHTVFVEHVPVLTRDMRNEAKRFVTLIDTLYDRGVRLIVSADAPPDGLYREGRHRFEFERTASRLREMQSEDYWQAA